MNAAVGQAGEGRCGKNKTALHVVIPMGCMVEDTAASEWIGEILIDEKVVVDVLISKVGGGWEG